MMPRLRPTQEQRQKQHALWGALHAFIRNNGGWITSKPDEFPIRFECRPEAALPDELRSLGYDLKDRGTEEKFLPVAEAVKQAGNITSITIQSPVPTTVLIFELDLPR